MIKRHKKSFKWGHCKSIRLWHTN